VLKASSWQNCSADEEIVREGDMDDRFYIVVAGNCAVERNGRVLGRLGTGDCFGESSYVPGARRAATVRATSSVTLLRVGSTLLEQASANCQLRFNRVFLRSLIERLQKAEDTAEVRALTLSRLGREAAAAPRARQGRTEHAATQPTGSRLRR
jgi:CRP-like cAMP-binding protein